MVRQLNFTVILTKIEHSRVEGHEMDMVGLCTNTDMGLEF
jgi:hypothetical protein